MSFLLYLLLGLLFSYPIAAQAETPPAALHYDIMFILQHSRNVTYDAQQAALASRVLKSAKQASLLYSERKQPLYGHSSLLLKAKGDYANILSALQNQAFYDGQISIKINGAEAHDLAANTRFPEYNRIIVTIMPGLPFRLHRISIASIASGKAGRYDETVFLPHSLDFRPGELAKAQTIREAQLQILRHLAELGYARARVLRNRITAQHLQKYMDIDMLIERGQKLYFSYVQIINTTPCPQLDDKLIAYFSGFVTGSLYTPQNMDAIRHNLESLDLFSAVVLQPGKNDAKGSTPLNIIVTEKPRRNISAGLEFASREGLGVNLTWLHRNLFGHGERLLLKAGGNAIDLTNKQHKMQLPRFKNFGYDFTVSFDKPGTLHYNAHSVMSLRAWREYSDYSNSKQLEAKAGMYKPLSEQWLGSAYLNLSDIHDYSREFGQRHFHIIGLDSSLSLDKRDNNLSPNRGLFFNARLNPFYASGGGHFATRLELEGRSYLPLDRNNNYILALRGKWGMIRGATLRQLPLSMQYFAGGAGSIRGYSYKSIGSMCPAHHKDRQCELGGLSMVLASAELRAKIWHKWGLAGFVDSGYVGQKVLNFKFKPYIGIGVGLRYNSRFGPLRVDIARPLHETKRNSHFQLYLGIGEVF